MRNEVVGCLFFCLLLIGVIFGLYFDRLELFGVIGLGLGLGVIFFFRKKN